MNPFWRSIFFKWVDSTNLCFCWGDAEASPWPPHWIQQKLWGLESWKNLNLCRIGIEETAQYDSKDDAYIWAIYFTTEEFNPKIPKMTKLRNAEEQENYLGPSSLLRTYLDKAIPLNALSLPIDRPGCRPIIHHEELEENSPKSRYTAAATLRKKNLRESRAR